MLLEDIATHIKYINLLVYNTNDDESRSHLISQREKLIKDYTKKCDYDFPLLDRHL